MSGPFRVVIDVRKASGPAQTPAARPVPGATSSCILRCSLNRDRPPGSNGDRCLLQILRFPSHCHEDPAPAARMVVEDEFLNRSGRHLSIRGEFQHGLGFAVRLSGSVQTVDVSLGFLHPAESVHHGGHDKEEDGKKEHHQRQSGHVADTAHSPFPTPFSQAEIKRPFQEGEADEDDNQQKVQRRVNVVQDIVAHFVGHDGFDLRESASLQEVVVQGNALGSEKPGDIGRNPRCLTGGVKYEDVPGFDAVGASQPEYRLANGRIGDRRVLVEERLDKDRADQ